MRLSGGIIGKTKVYQNVKTKPVLDLFGKHWLFSVYVVAIREVVAYNMPYDKAVVLCQLWLLRL